MFWWHLHVHVESSLTVMLLPPTRSTCCCVHSATCAPTRVYLPRVLSQHVSFCHLLITRNSLHYDTFYHDTHSECFHSLHI